MEKEIQRNPLIAFEPSRSQMNDQKAQPARQDTYGRVGADEHERKESKLLSEKEMVKQGAVQDKRD